MAKTKKPLTSKDNFEVPLFHETGDKFDDPIIGTKKPIVQKKPADTFEDPGIANDKPDSGK